MRVATWNMGYWGRSRVHDDAWRWLLDDLKPDVALLQECVVPDWVRDRAYVQFAKAYPASNRQKWGTAIVSTGAVLEPTTLGSAADWLGTLGAEAPTICSATRMSSWLVGGRLQSDEHGDLVFFSHHNPAFPIDRNLLKGVDVSEIKLTLNRDVWLLDVVFHFLREELSSPLIIGGDFNTSLLLDDPKPRGNAEFFGRLERAGFISLHRQYHDADEQTFFGRNILPHQLDYLYADATVAARTTNCYVLRTPTEAGLSDHAPLIAEVDR